MNPSILKAKLTVRAKDDVIRMFCHLDNDSQPARKKPRKQVNQSSDEEEEEGGGTGNEWRLHVQTTNA
jgi:hypothetical protein